VFDCLTLSAMINGTIFCVHGGLSPSITKLDEIKEVERKLEVPHDGSMNPSITSSKSYGRLILLWFEKKALDRAAAEFLFS
jgi:diadenosine tetraphosphatase ApaH/serine/threonine PP2A family protein phosphatase